MNKSNNWSILVLVYSACTKNNIVRSFSLQIRMILAAVLGPVNFVLAVIVAKRFGWLEFRIVGASEEFQSKLIGSHLYNL